LKKLFLLLTVALLTFGITACKPDDTPDDPDPVVVAAPVIDGVEDVDITVGDEFDPLAGVSATDEVDGNLTSDIEVSGTVDVDTVGEYTVTYSVTNSGGKTTTESRTVTVNNLPLTYPTGFYNYRFATSELRNTFFAAAERYLLITMDAGVPVFANAGFNIYSSRLQLPVDEHVPVMGYGTSFATMSADDSTVLMDDGQPGNVGEYTYRGSLTDNPTTFQQWLYDDSISADVIGWFLDAPYTYLFNDTMDGYDLAPSMASDMPQPIDPTVTETGMTVSKVWQIPIREGLEWTYHEDVAYDTSGWDNTIDANDFVDTYKKALEEGWFRAISGGGDFFNQATRVLNAEAFYDGEATWEEVGIKAIDDYTIEFTFAGDMSEWNVAYWMGSFVMGPVQLELMAALEADGDAYGTSPETTAYNGPYTMTYYQADSIVRYAKNPNFHDPDLYFFTHLDYRIIEDQEIRWQEFLAGKLEAASVPTANYDAVANDPRLKRVPGATTFRIMINGLGDVEGQQAQFPGSTYVPEPILANQDFKRAMYFAIDREELAEGVMKTSQTQQFLFTSAYFVDPATGVPFRNSEQAETVAEGLSPSTNGFNPDLAEAYWTAAIDALVADGTYSPGDEIELELRVFSGSESQVLFGQFIKDSFEGIFNSEEHDITVTVTVTPTQFPDIYYNFMMTGDFDISIGGISGSTLDAASFLDVYADDNRGGFTLNWGIDTSQANIEVEYFNPYLGENVREMWSFNAIASVLNGEKYIAEGAEAVVPAAKDFEYTPTSVTFTVDQFNNTNFENFSYTLYYYDLAAGYLEVEGQVDVPITSAEVTIDGLTPTYDLLDYLGDYEVHISFDYASEDDKSGTSVAPWWMQPTILADYEQTAETATSAVLSVTINEDDYAREITGAVVYDADTELVAGATVDFADESAITVSGLAAGASYYVVFTFDDGFEDYVSVDTAAE